VHNTPVSFSTVHFLNLKNNQETTSFINPAEFSRYVKFLQPELYKLLSTEDPTNSYMFDRCKVSAKEDDMIIFPSIFMHEIASQGSTNEPRITVSSNLRISKKKEYNIYRGDS